MCLETCHTAGSPPSSGSRGSRERRGQVVAKESGVQQKTWPAALLDCWTNAQHGLLTDRESAGTVSMMTGWLQCFVSRLCAIPSAWRRKHTALEGLQVARVSRMGICARNTYMGVKVLFCGGRGEMYASRGQSKAVRLKSPHVQPQRDEPLSKRGQRPTLSSASFLCLLIATSQAGSCSEMLLL